MKTYRGTDIGSALKKLVATPEKSQPFFNVTYHNGDPKKLFRRRNLKGTGIWWELPGGVKINLRASNKQGVINLIWNAPGQEEWKGENIIVSLTL